MKTIFIPVSVVALLLSSCSSITENMQNIAAKKITETLIGQKVDSRHLRNVGESTVISALKIDGESVFSDAVDLAGSFTAYPDNIIVQISGNDDSGKLVVTLTGNGIYNQKPYAGVTQIGEDTEGTVKGNIMLSRVMGQNQAELYMMQSGTVTLTSFSEYEVIVSIQGEIANPIDEINGIQAKEISGYISLIRPALVGVGIEIGEIVY